jgi:hypothetical protein
LKYLIVRNGKPRRIVTGSEIEQYFLSHDYNVTEKENTQVFEIESKLAENKTDQVFAIGSEVRPYFITTMKDSKKRSHTSAFTSTLEIWGF